MLHHLRISNLALLDSAELEFARGLTAVTGETGAGKSVLLGALALLSGSRADKGLIRKGADACEVEGTLHFQHPDAINAKLRELNLPECEDGTLLVHRVLPREKPARITVNGRNATLAALGALGGLWIDFHGPGEPQKLFHESCQLELLDLHARLEAPLAAYQVEWRRWRDLHAEAERLRTSEKLSPEEAEFIKAQITKIDSAKLSEEGIGKLEADFKRFSSARDILSLASELSQGLVADQLLGKRLSPLRNSAFQLARLETSAEPLAKRVESVIIELQDLSSEFASLADDCDFNPAQAQALTERMDLWIELRRKYGTDVATILAKRAALANRLAIQGDLEGAISRVLGEAAKLEKTLRVQAAALTATRRAAADDLGTKVGAILVNLGFKKPRLAIELLPEAELREHGDSRCRIVFAPNAGQDLLPLSQIASSGELARVMLALKAVLARVDSTPVLVFDEVDANVGGEIAAVVGRELAALGQDHQVYCVTHLPQVAAQASAHFVVVKDQTEDATTVTISPLDPDSEERVRELARMVGDRHSASALDHARELLQKPAAKAGTTKKK